MNLEIFSILSRYSPHTLRFCVSSAQRRNSPWKVPARVMAVWLFWLNDDEVNEIDERPSEVIFTKFSGKQYESRRSLFLYRTIFGDRVQLTKGHSSTSNARIMCPGLMVRAKIRDSAMGAHRNQRAPTQSHVLEYQSRDWRSSPLSPNFPLADQTLTLQRKLGAKS